MASGTFYEAAWALVSKVPAGRVVTYGQVATYAGSARAARAVGNLMRDAAANGVDCAWQRIINSTGGISYKGDLVRGELQVRLLRAEGVFFDQRQKCDLAVVRWAPPTTFWAEYDGGPHE